MNKSINCCFKCFKIQFLFHLKTIDTYDKLQTSNQLHDTYIENVNIDKYLICQILQKQSIKIYLHGWTDCGCGHKLVHSGYQSESNKISSVFLDSVCIIRLELQCNLYNQSLSRQQKFSFKIWRSISSRSAKKLDSPSASSIEKNPFLWRFEFDKLRAVQTNCLCMYVHCLYNWLSHLLKVHTSEIDSITIGRIKYLLFPWKS